MIYYIHSCAPDTPLLRLCVDRLFALSPDACVIVANDPTCPIPAEGLPKNPRLHVIKTPYPCGGNLNGMQMIEGMLEVFIQIMEANHNRHIVKLDCDAWLNSTEWLKEGFLTPDGSPEPDYIGLERMEPMTAAGDCYRISLYAARAALKRLRERTWPPQINMPEDKTILDLVLRSRLPVLTIPYSEGKHVGMHQNLPGARENSAWVVHCGETCVDGKRAPRDFVLLRMRLLAALKTNTPAKS